MNPADAKFSNGLAAGSVLTAAGIIVPVGAIPEGGAAADCSDVADARIGTFYVRGNIVLGLPAAAPNDRAYVESTDGSTSVTVGNGRSSARLKLGFSDLSIGYNRIDEPRTQPRRAARSHRRSQARNRPNRGIASPKDSRSRTPATRARSS